jgi:hypothetical protein
LGPDEVNLATKIDGTKYKKLDIFSHDIQIILSSLDDYMKLP